MDLFPDAWAISDHRGRPTMLLHWRDPDDDLPFPEWYVDTGERADEASGRALNAVW